MDRSMLSPSATASTPTPCEPGADARSTVSEASASTTPETPPPLTPELLQEIGRLGAQAAAEYRKGPDQDPEDLSVLFGS